MSDFSNEPTIVSNGPTSFFQTWVDALTKPNEQTYAKIASSPEANPTKAYVWIFIASLVNFLIVLLAQGAIMRNMLQQFGDTSGGIRSTLGGGILAALCGAPFSAIFSVLAFAIVVVIVQWVAKMFGGQGNFNQLAYTWGAIIAPYTLVSSVLTLLSAIPFVGFCFTGLGVLGGIYVLVLEVMSVKAVNRFGWGGALGAVFLPGLVIGLLCACLIAVSALLLGPTIGDIFNSINQSLGVY